MPQNPLICGHSCQMRGRAGPLEAQSGITSTRHEIDRHVSIYDAAKETSCLYAGILGIRASYLRAWDGRAR